MKYTETREWSAQAEERLSDVKDYLRFKDQTDKAEEAIRVALNVLTQRQDVADILFHALRIQHRTHQQSIISNLYRVLIRFGQSDTDARNEAAVKWAAKATKEESFFPFI